MNQISKRQKYDLLRSQLEADRSSFMSHWRDLSDYILVNRARFTVSQANRGERKNLKINDSTASLAARTLRSGMMSGVTSPARPWFRLTTPDPSLSDVQAVKVWLDTVTQRMSSLFIRSNLYNVLPIIYGDLGVFGTAAMLVDEDEENLLSFSAVPIGSYMIGTNEQGKVDIFMRDFKMTVRQIVKKFGKLNPETGEISNWDNFSRHVRSLYENKNFGTWIEVCHVIMPNDDYNPKKIQSKFKRYISCYFERGQSGTNTSGNYMGSEGDKFLREAGYDYFPVLCPRWETTGEDVYGTDCPGMLALGDIKALQTMQKRKAQAVEKMVNPPLKGPSTMKTQKVSLLPGDITYVNDNAGLEGLRAIHEVNLRIQELSMDIQEHQMRIRKAFFEDLILMLAQSDRRQITAREIDERHEEKLLAFGPVLEQLNQDLLDPLIDIAFQTLVIRTQRGENLLPEPPKEIQGMDLKVDYVSVMAQAQKLVGLSGIERFTGYVSQVASIDPTVLDKVNRDQLIDVYGDLTSVPPSLLVSDDEVQAIRGERAKAQQQAQQAELAKTQASTIKDLGAAKVDEQSMLSQLIG